MIQTSQLLRWIFSAEKFGGEFGKTNFFYRFLAIGAGMGVVTIQHTQQSQSSISELTTLAASAAAAAAAVSVAMFISAL